MNILSTGNNNLVSSTVNQDALALVENAPKPDVDKVKEVANVKWQYQLHSSYYNHQQDLVDTYMGTESDEESQSSLAPATELTELYTEAYYLKLKKYYYDELKESIPSPEDSSIQPVEDEVVDAMGHSRMINEYQQVSNSLPSSLVTIVA